MIQSTNIILLFTILFIIFFIYTSKSESFTSNQIKNNNGNKYVDLILYHADWCGHCKSFKPIWNNLINVIKSSDEYNYIKTKDINCTYNTNKDLLSPNGQLIYGFPTIIICIKNNNKIINEYSYESERSINAILEFIKEKIISN